VEEKGLLGEIEAKFDGLVASFTRPFKEAFSTESPPSTRSSSPPPVDLRPTATENARPTIPLAQLLPRVICRYTLHFT
jgi:hypothetical protein